MATGMELLLNLAWFLLAVTMSAIWLCFAPRDPAPRRVQLVALAVVILILLPAISMTDDLLAAQNPAETDSYLRRDHEISSPYSIFPGAAVLPLPGCAGLGLRSQRLAAPSLVPASGVQSLALSSIQSRPPPEA
jgi:hypothetical protein